MTGRSDPAAPATLTIRAFLPQDTEACTAIFARAWRAGHPHVPRWIDRVIFERETTGEAVLVAATAAGRPVGFVGIYRPDRFIHHLYVDPDWHGQGIGRELLGSAVRLLGAEASLKCQAANTHALAFYAHLGWTEGEIGESENGRWIRLLSPSHRSPNQGSPQAAPPPSSSEPA